MKKLIARFGIRVLERLGLTYDEPFIWDVHNTLKLGDTLVVVQTQHEPRGQQ